MTTLTAAETAVALATRLNYVYGLLRTGHLDGELVDGVWRVDAASVEAYAKRRQYRHRARPERDPKTDDLLEWSRAL